MIFAWKREKEALEKEKDLLLEKNRLLSAENEQLRGEVLRLSMSEKEQKRKMRRVKKEMENWWNYDGTPQEDLEDEDEG